MELVYLWVEEYKNIKKQGFNFSPRFKCHYDETTNELTINENREYVSILPENINVTAIVGENGSGKSSIFELISFFRFEHIRNITDKKIVLVFKYKNILYATCESIGTHYFNCSDVINNKTSLLVKQNNITSYELFQLTLFTNGLNDFTMQDEKHEIMRTSHFDSFYNGEHIHYKTKEDDKQMHDEFNAKYAFMLHIDDNFFEFIGERFLFNKMYIELDTSIGYKLNFYNKDEYIEQYKKINSFYSIDFEFIDGNSLDDKSEIKKDDKQIELIYKFLSFYFLQEYLNTIQNFTYDMNDSFKKTFMKEFLDYIFIALDHKEAKKSKLIVYITIITFTKKYFNNLKNIIKKVFEDRLGMLDDFKQNSNRLIYITKFLAIIKIIEKNFHLEDFESNNENFFFVTNTVSINDNLIKKFYKHIEKSFLLQDFYNSNIIKLEFINQIQSYNYRKLSTGEKQFLEFIVSFAYTIENMKYTNKSIILIEEIEIAMHPQWQKKLLNIVINIFKKLNLVNNDLNYQIIFATHSAFLLSDIPKENVIFLDKYKENDIEVQSSIQKVGNCKQVYPFDDNQQTFGANIHTLLSHGFFMKDGLMGEFAKSKINEIIEFHNRIKADNMDKKALTSEYENKKTQFWHIQKIVGEDYLKQVIKNHLIEIEKILLGKDEAKNAEIRRVEAYLNSLKND